MCSFWGEGGLDNSSTLHSPKNNACPAKVGASYSNSERRRDLVFQSVPSWPLGAMYYLVFHQDECIFPWNPKNDRFIRTCFFRMIFRFHVGISGSCNCKLSLVDSG